VCIFVIYIEFFHYCLSVSNSQVIGCEDRLSEMTYTVGWGVKLYSIQSMVGMFDIVLKCEVMECEVMDVMFDKM